MFFSRVAACTRTFLASLCALAFFPFFASGATLVADYRLEGSLKSSVGSAPELTIERASYATFDPTDVLGSVHPVLTLPSGITLRIDTTGLLASNRYTAVVLVAMDTVAGYQRLFEAIDPSVGHGWWVINGANSVYTSSDPGSTGTHLLADKEFVQLVFTKDGASARAYVNGVKDVDFNDSENWMQISPDGVIRLLGDSTGQYAPGGKVARIRLYQGALSDGEIAALDKLQPVAAPAASGASVVADYRFEDTIKSSVAGAPDAVLEGGLFAQFLTDSVAGSSRTVLDFSAGMGFSINTTGLLNPEHYSVVALFEFRDVVGYGRIFDVKDPSDVTGAFITGGKVGYHPELFSANVVVTNNTYAQITYAVDGKQVRAFVGGTKVLDLVDFSQHGIISSNLIRFFRDSDGAYAPGGRVARIRLLNGVLTDSEVAALTPLAAPPAPGNAVPPAPNSEYVFQESLQSSVPGAPTLALEGKHGSFVLDTIGGVARTVLQVEAGDGLGLSTAGLLDPDHYAVSLVFALNNVGGYARVLDVKDPTDVTGIFILSGTIGFHSAPYTLAAVATNGAYLQVTLVKDGLYERLYVRGTKVLDVLDLQNRETISGNLIHFLHSADGNYGVGGRIARIRTFNAVLNDAQVAALDYLPPVKPPASAGAQLVGDYAFQNNFESSVSGAPAIVPSDNSAVSFESSSELKGKTVLRFNSGQGLSLATKGLVDPHHYSVALGFELDNTTGYGRLLDPKDPTETQAWFIVNNAVTYLATAYTTAPLVSANDFIELVIVADGPQYRLYGSDRRLLSFFDADEHGAIGDSGLISLFRSADGSYAPGGRVTRVRLFNGALTDTEVAALVPAVPSTDLGEIPAGANVALSFSNGYLDVPSPSTVQAPFTVEFWALPGGGGVLGTRQPAEYGFDVKFTGTAALHGDIGSGTAWLTTSADYSFPQPITNWTHIAYVVRPDSYTIMVNGAPVVTNAISAGDLPLLYDAAHQLRIGTSYGGEYFSGQLDEIRIWNRARAAAEIASDYNRVLRGDEAGLVNYYRFSEGRGISTADLAPAGGSDTANFTTLGTTLRWVTTGPDIDTGGWNAARDLRKNEIPFRDQTVLNPNATVPAWSYGYRPASELATTHLTLYSAAQHLTNFAGSPQLSGWGRTDGDGPSMSANISGDPVVLSFCCGPLVPIQTGEMGIWPASDGMAGVVRWIAPSAGDYSLTAYWHKIDLNADNGSVSSIVVNGQILFTTNWFNAGHPGFTNTVHFSSGDIVDFAFSSLGSYSFGGAAFNAIIAPASGGSASPPDLVLKSIQAPASLAPGVPINIIYTVANEGSGPANASWTDAVYLTPNPQGAQGFLLDAFLITNSLAPGASLTFTQQVVLPPSGPNGALYFVVVTDSGNALAESNEGNNSMAAANSVSVTGTLTVAISTTTVSENAQTGNVSTTVSRNGDVANALTVTLQSSDTTRATVPSTLVIPAGRATLAFFVSFHQDGLLTGPKTVTVTATANGFQPGKADLTLLDADLPALSIALAPARLTEGAASSATLTRQGNSASALTVNLSGPLGRLTFPTTVTVPAGTNSINFSVTSVDNTTPSATQTNILSASAPGYLNGTGQLLVDDNDVPNLSILLARSIVSEGDGPQATTGTITRDHASPNDLVVNLTSGNPQVAKVPATVVIPAGETSTVFTISVVDNNIIDGNRQVAIGGALLEPGTGVKLADAAPVSLRVTDDDGPTLKLVFGADVVAEGASPATTGTVSRNGTTTAPLTVTLASSDTLHVKIPATVVIPAGSPSTTFQIDTIRDSVAAGNQAVTVSASAAGLTGSSRTLVVSDSALADLIVASLSIPLSVDSDTFFKVGFRVENQGLYPSGTNFTQRIYLSNDPLLSSDDPLLLENTFPGSVAASGFFEQTLQARSPQAPGDYWVIAVVDASNVVPEMAENNNTTVSSAPLHVRKAYSATVLTALKTAPANTPVPLHGQATLTASNAPAQFVTVDLSIRVRGTERHIAAITDASGNYSTTFQPLPGEGGVYSVAADYPGTTNSPTQATFTLLGMSIDPVPPVNAVEGSTLIITNAVNNLADSPLTGLTATLVSAPQGVIVTPTLASALLASSDSVLLRVQIAPATGSASGTVVVRVRSAEGIILDVNIPITVEAARARLVAFPESLETGMRRGGQTVVQLVVTNSGSLETGPLNVLAPPIPWLKVSSGTLLPSLPSGGAATITLLLTPAPDLDLGPYTGTILLKSDTTGLSVPFTFRNLSDSVGNLVLDAVDEYTYYAAGSPKVTNAFVTIRDAVTKDLVLTNVTGADGTLVIQNLREAYYDIQVTADGHSAFNKTGLIQAGKDNPLTAFLSRQTVRYIFSVVPTEIEDRTKIVITTEFETFVPIPVVTVDPPYFDLSNWSGTSTQVNVTLMNHGLLAANNVRFTLPSSPGVEFSSLISTIGDLPAQGSMTIPIVIKLASASARPGNLHALAAGSCYADASFEFDLVCGPQVNTYNVPLRFDKLPGCPQGHGDPAFVHFEPFQANPPAYGQGLGGWSTCPTCFAPGPFYFPPPLITSPPQNCNPCVLGVALAAFCVKSGFGPGAAVSAAKCAIGAATCGYGLATKGITFGTAAGCLSSMSACRSNPPGPFKVPACLTKASACLPPKYGGFGLSGKSASSVSALSNVSADDQTPPEALPLIRQLDRALALLAPMTNLFGSPVWLSDASDDSSWITWFTAFDSAITSSSDASYQISAAELAQLMALPVPISALQPDDVRAFVARWNRTMDYYSRGIFNLADVPAGQSTDFIATDVESQLSQAALAANDAAVADGYSDPFTALEQASDEFLAKANSAGGGSCAHVKLEIDQQAVITRDAFNATLEIDNATDDTLSNISIELVMHNANGDDTTQTFFVRPPVLQGLTATDGTGQIAPHTNGKASWVLIPTSDAAPDGQVTHLVGGTLRYQQAGTLVTIPLLAQSIHVFPNAALTLKYFHQRDVFADDPFTDEIEPSVPYSLAVMIQNSGKGVAKSVHITSAQPKIIDNKKGLLIDFSIIATDVDGQSLTPSLDADFGDINPGQIKIGRWLLKSTLQGLFTDYSASFQNIDGLGDKKVALIQNVEIHEMDHIVQADRSFEDGHPDFLANDVPDFDDYPDTLYFSQGTTAPVAVVTNAVPDASVSADHLTINLTANMRSGWAYLRVAEPSNGQFKLKEVRRPDGTIVALETNVWVTDRTFIGFSQKPVRENILHLLDYNTNAASISYQLTYLPAAAADDVSPTSAVAALPANSPASIPVTWRGSDNASGSGIAYYDVYVSINGGSFQPWLTKTADTGALYSGQVGSTYAFYSVATDFAGNNEPVHAAADATTAVNLVNTAPVLTVSADQTLDEGALVILNNSATDSDLPANSLTFSLGSSAPAGAQIDPATGRITWNTSEATGPSTNKIPVIVRDNGQPSLSATGLVTVIVREVNVAPVMQVLTNRVIDELQTLRVQVTATDADLPTNHLTFALLNPPRGATITASGLLNWRPDNTQGPSTNDLQVIVTDDGTPRLSATNHLLVMVRDTEGDFDLAFDSLVARTGGDYTLNLNLNSGLDLTSITCALEISADRIENLRIEPSIPELASATLIPAPTGGYFLQLQAAAGQVLTGYRAIAAIRFDAGTSTKSEIVYFDTSDVSALRSSSQVAQKGSPGRGRVVLIGNEPLLSIRRDSPHTLELFGIPSKSYVLQQSGTANSQVAWPPVSTYLQTNLLQTFPISSSGRMNYYRVQQQP